MHRHLACFGQTFPPLRRSVYHTPNKKNVKAIQQISGFFTPNKEKGQSKTRIFIRPSISCAYEQKLPTKYLRI
jgi:hypothetical protein